jgi:ribosomal protein S27E
MGGFYNPARMPPAQATVAIRAPLSYVLTCPHCGAPSEVDAESRSFVCAHCGSFLAVDHPGRDEIFVAESQVKDAEAVREVVILYRVQSQRAEIVERWGQTLEDGTRQPPPEVFIQQKLRQYEERLRETVRVIDAHRLQIPYWHVSGSIVQAVLGRRQDGPKEVKLRSFAVEHSVPAYDVRRFNLRDRGLRLSGARVRPLRRADMPGLGPYLPWAPIAEQTYQEIRRFEGRDLIPGFEPVVKRGRFCFGRRILVYRPVWLARVITDAGQSLVLVDAGFATIGGYPSEAEGIAMLRGTIDDPEGPESRETRAVVVKSRCPDCGHEAAFDTHAVVVACPNCHRGLELHPEAIRLVEVGHAGDDLDATWLPFWSFPFRARVGTQTLDSLDAWTKTLHPRGLPPGAPRGAHVLVPAFELLGTEVGDEAFQELVAWAHASAPDAQPEKVPIGGRPEFVGATLPAEEARELLPWVLWAMNDRASAARLSTLVVKQSIEAAKLEPGEPQLVFLPFERKLDAIFAAGGPTLPRLLFDGGPALLAQRVSVAKAASTA